MKKIIAAVALALTATSAMAETAEVYHYTKNKKVTISLSDIKFSDLYCIATLSLYRDVTEGNNKSEYKRATSAQDKYFLKYDYTIPTKWINQVKLSVSKEARKDLQWFIKSSKECTKV